MAECEYMLEQERSSVEYEDALRVVYRQGKKMSRLIEDMLMFTRMERRADVFSMKELNFSQLAEDVCEDMCHIAEKNISLSARIEPKIWIFGNYDPARTALNKSDHECLSLRKRERAHYGCAFRLCL